jgi:hypothetical protein
MMSDLTERFKVLEDNYQDALATLEGVLKHVSDTKPDPALRVVILNNVIVTLISSLEETLRDIFRQYLTILEESVKNHQWLRVELQEANLDCAIKLLRDYKTHSKFDDATAVVKDLLRCLNGEPGYKLFKHELTYNKGNFRSLQVTDVAKNVGFAKLWNRIADSQEVEAYTGASNLDTRMQQLIIIWNAAFEERDVIVHNISKANGWSADQIRQAMALSRLVINRIASCLTSDLASLIEQHDLRLAAESETGKI